MIDHNWMAYTPKLSALTNSTSSDSRLIPHGDYYLHSCTVGNYSYHQTNTGFFKKLHNSILFIKIDKEEFDLAYEGREVFNFCPRLVSPQAGLTRGSKGTTSLNLKKQKHVIFQKWLNIPLSDRPSLKTFEEVELKKLNEGSI